MAAARSEPERATFRIPSNSGGRRVSQLIIKFHIDAIDVDPRFHASGMLARRSARRLEGVPKILEYLRDNHGLKEIFPLLSKKRPSFSEDKWSSIAPNWRIFGRSLIRDSSEALSGLSVLHIDPRSLSYKLIRKLTSTSSISYAEAVPERFLFSSTQTAAPETNRQWGLRAVDWFTANLPDASSRSVAILDTGIDIRHRELSESIGSYRREGVSKNDVIGHGTHVSGIVGAHTNNRVGIAGVSNCKIAMWKVFDDEPDTSNGEFAINGEYYLRSLGEVLDGDADVLNLSLGGNATCRTEKLIIDEMIRRGKVVVAAMGNEFEAGNPVQYPAANEDVIAVGSVNEAGRRSRFSNTGEHIDIVAPGSNILSTLPVRRNRHRDEHEYAAWSGTSMAAPYISATAILLRARNPNLSVTQIRRAIVESASKLDGMKRKNWTEEYGHGLLNIRSCLSHRYAVINDSIDKDI